MKKEGDPMRKRSVWKDRAAIVFCIAACAGALCGCAGTELENKHFPLAVLVEEKGEQYQVCYLAQKLSEVANERADGGNQTAVTASGSTYYETQNSFEKNNRCQLDLSHTKALIFQEDFIKSDELGIFLDTVRREDLYARNTLVYLADGSMEKLMKLNDTLEIPLGSYLEQMTENEQERKEQSAVTLGMLLNEQANEERTILLPVLKEEKGMPVIHAYDVLQDFTHQGRISLEEAEIYFLLGDQLQQFDLKLKNGVQVRLTGLTCKREFFDAGRAAGSGRVTEQIALYADAQRITGKVTRPQVEESLREMIAQACIYNKEENHTDLTDSYRRLAKEEPELYRSYKGRTSDYRGDLNYQVQVHIRFV